MNLGTITALGVQALSLFPYVLQSVVAIEAVAKNLPGATKLQMLLNSVGAVAGVTSQLPDMIGVISKLTASIVNDLNVSGIFTKKDQTPALTGGSKRAAHTCPITFRNGSLPT